MNKKNDTPESNKAINYEPLLAVVNYNAVNTWLEPYIGHSFEIIKKGVKKTWFKIYYGKLVVRKTDSSLFNYC